MLKRVIILICVVFFSISSKAADTKVVNYVDDLLQKSLAILQNPNQSLSEKIEQSEKLMSINMDLEWMSKFVLGKYRRSISQDELKEFTSLYSQYIVKSYSTAVKFYKPNQTIKVKSETPLNKDEYVVKTALIFPGGEPINIDYLIREVDGHGFKVFDVVTEGISLINSHQAEFANVISNSDFQSLIKQIKEKIKSIDNANHGTK